MLPLAHVGIAALFAKNFKPYILPVTVAGFFALLPDLIDKPLFLLGLAPSSRFIAHTIFFGIIVSAIVFLAVEKKVRAQLALAALLGCWSHLLLDSYGFLPLFYPVVPYSFPPVMFDFTFNVLTILFEIIGFCCLMFVVLESQGDERK